MTNQPLFPTAFTSAAAARQFITAGNATVTFKSLKSGTHFTYRIRAPHTEEGKPDNGFRFVSLMTGPDNETSFSYFGYLKPSQAGVVFCHGGGKAKVAYDTPSVRAFAWAWQQLQNQMPDQLEIWHEGRCGRCARKLTHPDSIASGFGPECAGRFEALAI
jgi:hypothetical protein